MKTHAACRCGAVRYDIDGEPMWQAYCHCVDCRQATGAPVAAFVGFPGSAVTAVRGAASTYEKVAGIRRGFCAKCGSPLTYQDDRLAGEIYFYVGVMEDPAAFPPDRHAYSSEHLPWLEIADGLERCEATSRPRPGGAEETNG